jgi:hypothetical protein
MFSKSVVIAALLLGAFGPVRACAFDIGFGNPFALPHPRSLEVAMAVHGAVQRGGFDVAAAGPDLAPPAFTHTADHHRAPVQPALHMSGLQRLLLAPASHVGHRRCPQTVASRPPIQVPAKTTRARHPPV